MISKDLIKKTADYFASNIKTAKVVINNIRKDATIRSISVSANGKIKVFVDFLIAEEDIINAIEFYDEKNIMVISDNVSLDFNITSATYLYENNFISNVF